MLPRYVQTTKINLPLYNQHQGVVSIKRYNFAWTWIYPSRKNPPTYNMWIKMKWNLYRKIYLSFIL